MNVDGQQVLSWPPKRQSNLEEGLKRFLLSHVGKG